MKEKQIPTEYQMDLFGEDEPQSEPQPDAPKVCPHSAPEKFQHHWWSSSNTHLCYETHDCSHCHITNKMELIRNHIHKRENCFCCTKATSKLINGKWQYECQVTGNKWEAGSYRMSENYNINPIHVPCSFCDLASCDRCLFKREVSENNPYGCCGACAHRLYCIESKCTTVKTAEEFIYLIVDRNEYENDCDFINFSAGVTKKSYSSDCPFFGGYMCDGVHSFSTCACVDKKVKADIYRAICSKNYTDCILYRERKDKTEGEK